jgi:MFS family permease
LAVITGLILIRTEELHPVPRAPRSRGQLRAGLRYAWSTPELRLPLLMMAVIGTLSYNFQVTLPLMAHFVFRGGGGTYGAMSSIMATGSLAGALVAASQVRPTRRRLLVGGFVFGALVLAASAAPSLGVELLVLVPMGAASVFFITSANSLLQLAARGDMRGRVMALYAIVFLGSTPIGGPIVGWVGGRFGARAALRVGAAAAIGTALVAMAVVLRQRRARFALTSAPGPRTAVESAAAATSVAGAERELEPISPASRLPSGVALDLAGGELPSSGPSPDLAEEALRGR